MDAFYRALGAAGGMPFEPSSVFSAPRPPFKQPTPAAGTRDARAASAPATPPHGAFEDERPGRTDAVAGSGKALKIGAVLAGLAIGVVAVGFALRGATRSRPPPRRRPPRRATTQAAPPPVGRAGPSARRRAVRGRGDHRPSPPAEAQAPLPADAASKSGGRKHRRGAGDESKPDPAHRKIDIPAEPTPARAEEPLRPVVAAMRGYPIEVSAEAAAAHRAALVLDLHNDA